MVRRVADTEATVLITGESGTGKELVARAIHSLGSRREGPFVAGNCAALPAELIEAELFGVEKGAFTGAHAARAGRFERADGGTLFLDEVGDLPLDAQAKLLRAIQQKEVTPVGESTPVGVDVRILAATHRDLMADVAAGRFREDLFHRLAVGIIHLPPLRERTGDIDFLADHFLDSFNADTQNRPEGQEKKFSQEARNFLNQHPWPGNVRELYHTLLRATIWSIGETLTADDISSALLTTGRAEDQILGRPLTKGFDLQALLDEVTRHYLSRAMAQAGNRKKHAAELLGIANYQTLTNKLTRLGLPSGDKNE